MQVRSDNGEARDELTSSLPGASVSLLDGVAVAVYAVDAQARCTSINASAASMLGFTEEECMGRNMHELIHYKYPDGAPFPIEECPLMRARHDGVAAYHLRETVWRKDGQPVQVLCSAVPIVANGAVQSTMITLNDIRRQHAAEDRLLQMEDVQREAMRQRDAAARVEQELATDHANRQREDALAAERATAEELRRQQRQVEEQLVQSERLAAVGRLSASISHEINNPLEAVTNLLYLVRSDASISSESMNYIQMAEEELGRVTEIVSQTLRFQRGGGTPSDCVPEKLLGSVIALHAGRLHNTGITIARDHRRSRPFRCAEGDLRQVLNNLISNAIDAMRSAGGTITIRTQPARHSETGKEGLRITIADTGHGMSPATAAKIFEPLYTTKGDSGSGLGLWISSSIARRHGGRLKVRSSREGKHRGTTFSLFLPEIDPEPASAGTLQ